MQPTKFTYTAPYRCLEHLRKNSVDLYLCYCGMEKCEPSHCYGPHIRNEYLIAVKLHHSLERLVFVRYLREIKYSLKVERIVHIQMNPEKRLSVIMEHLAVEVLVFLVLTL